MSESTRKTQITPTRSYHGEILSVAIVGFCSYYVLSMLSFDPFDPSSFSAGLNHTSTKNLGGRIGAQLSASLIFYLGLIAYLLPLPLLTVAFSFVQRSPNYVRLTRLAGCMVLLFSLTGMIAKSIGTIRIQNVELPVSGTLGTSLKQLTTQYLGVGGSWVLLVHLFVISLILMTQRQLIEFMMKKLGELSKSVSTSLTWLRSSPDLATAAVGIPFEPAIAIDHSPIEHVLDEDLGLDDSDADDTPHIRLSPSYSPPSVSLFKTSESKAQVSAQQKKEFEQTAQILKTSFADFGISGDIVAIQPGPVVTVFEFQPDAGTKLAKINSLVDDIAMAMRVDSIIMHPVRGKRAVGIQIPNQDREMVRLGDIIQSPEFTNASSPLTIALGKALAGEPVCADLTKMPHLLTAGATGSGKSVAINTLLCSIIMKASPAEVRMILVDPKMLELSMYEGIPHLLMPVITEPGRAAIALKWATQEMERRYKLMQQAKVRNIVGFNDFCRQSTASQRQQLLGEQSVEALPYILLVIDELADLMMTAPKEVESLIQRLAQKARASGIHLVLATQRPSVDIITGVIKANLPCRAAFQVVSKHDSRTILDQNGADKLLGNGDMLFQRPGSNRLERIQGAFISDDEVIQIVEDTKSTSAPEYDHQVMQWIDTEVARVTESSDMPDHMSSDDDPKYEEAKQIAQNQGYISASYLQRQLKIGYNRAARMVETMESQGLVDKADGAKPRQWRGI